MVNTFHLPLRHDERSPSSPILSPDAGVKERWKFRRDLVIYLAFRLGFSRKYLAEVFDLHRTRINMVLDRLSAYDAAELPRDPALADLPKLASADRLPRGFTPGQRWRFRRNLLIHVAHRQGLSQRFIADVFDLPRSRVAEILKEFAYLERDGVEPEMARGF